MQDAADTAEPTAPAARASGSRTLHNTVLVVGARTVSQLLALVVFMLMNRHLTAGQYGVFQTVVSISGLVRVALDLGFNTLFQREAARQPGELSRYLSTLLAARLLFATGGLGLFLLALWIVHLEHYLFAGFVMMVLASCSYLLRLSLYAVQRLKAEATAIVLESVILVSSVGFGALTHQGPGYYLWAYALTYALDCVYFLLVLHLRHIARLTLSLDFGLVRQWFWSSLPFALTSVITSIYFSMNQPMITFFRGPTESGWYASSYKLFASVLFLPTTMLTVVFPVLAIMHTEAGTRLRWAVNRFYKALLLIGWPLTVGSVMLTPAFRFIYQYGPSELSFQILSVGVVFMFLTNAFMAALNAADHQLSFTWAAFWSMVINVTLNLIVIPRAGYLGAAWVTVITELALCVLGWFLTARHVAAVPVHRLSWRILVAGLVMGAALIPFHSVTGWKTIPVIAGGALVYGLALLLIRAIDPEEWTLVRNLVPGFVRER